MFSKKSLMFALICSVYFTTAVAKTTRSEENAGGRLNLELANEHIFLGVAFHEGVLVSEQMRTSDAFAATHHGEPVMLTTDGGFRLDLFWTNWRFPGKDNNGDNRVALSHKDFRYKSHRWNADAQAWEVLMTAQQHSLEVSVFWSLGDEDFYVRRKVTVADPKHGGHFLEAIHGYDAVMSVDQASSGDEGDFSIIIEGSETY